MSRLGDLIAEHCANGVEYLQLQHLFDARNGYTPSKSNASLWTDGTIPWFRMEDIRENGGVLSDAMQHIPQAAVKGGRLFPANSIIVATSATIGEHALITVPHLSNQRFTSLALKPRYADQLDMKFVYYYCFVLDEWCRNNVTTSSFASVDMAAFKTFRFPIVPLEVQHEVVRVLDHFTDLEVELDAELESRRRQLDFYRDKLLTFPESRGIPKIPMGALAQIGTGRSDRVNAVAGGLYPLFVRSKDVLAIDTYEFDEKAVIIPGEGGLGEIFHYVDGKYGLHQRAYRIHPIVEELDAKFLYHYLAARFRKYIASRAVTATVTSIRKPMLTEMPIPLPPLDEQRRIASHLDKLDALVNDLGVGLPAELKARRQQYEYYRDKLLTFPEAGA